MPSWVLTTVGSVLISLTVTLVFNKIIGIPKVLKKTKGSGTAQRSTN